MACTSSTTTSISGRPRSSCVIILPLASHRLRVEGGNRVFRLRRLSNRFGLPLSLLHLHHRCPVVKTRVVVAVSQARLLQGWVPDVIHEQTSLMVIYYNKASHRANIYYGGDKNP